MPNEYPRLLYRERETRRVESAEDEATATADGFGRDVSCNACVIGVRHVRILSVVDGVIPAKCRRYSRTSSQEDAVPVCYPTRRKNRSMIAFLPCRRPTGARFCGALVNTRRACASVPDYGA